MPKELVKVYDSGDAIVLPAWDPMVRGNHMHARPILVDISVWCVGVKISLYAFVVVGTAFTTIMISSCSTQQPYNVTTYIFRCYQLELLVFEIGQQPQMAKGQRNETSSGNTH